MIDIDLPPRLRPIVAAVRAALAEQRRQARMARIYAPQSAAAGAVAARVNAAVSDPATRPGFDQHREGSQ